MCPEVHTDDEWNQHKTHIIVKRNPLSIVGVVALVAVVIVGSTLAVMAYIQSNNDYYKIEELQDKYNIMRTNVLKLESELNATNIMVTKLTQNVNETVLKLADHEEDFEEMQWKSVAQTYAISGLVSKLQIFMQKFHFG